MENLSKHVRVIRKEYWFDFLNFSRYSVRVNGKSVGNIQVGESAYGKVEGKKMTVLVERVNMHDMFTVSSSTHIFDIDDKNITEIEIFYPKRFFYYMIVSIVCIFALVLIPILQLNPTVYVGVFIALFVYVIFSFIFTLTPDNIIRLRKIE